MDVSDSWNDLLRWLLAEHLALIIGALIMLLLLSGMLRQRRNPAASAAWLLFMLLLPYIAVPLYLFFGTRKLTDLTRRKQRLFSRRAQHDQELPTQFQRLLHTLEVPPSRYAADIRFHTDAEDAYRTLTGMLEAARDSIDISIFILAADKVGTGILDLLARKAEAGVRVRLLLDGVGSFPLKRRSLKALLGAGAEVTKFVPVLHVPLRGRTNLRNHRKLVIVDQERVWTGGRNIAAEYLLPETSTGWIDLSFDLSGSAVADYAALFNADWAFACQQPLRPPVRPRESLEQADAGRLTQLVPSGPDMAEDVLRDTLALMITQAENRILLVTPYLVPDEVLQTLLCVAARSGTSVDILLPKRSNHRIADIARTRFLRQLNEAGVRIWCLPDEMLHAKALVIDQCYALAGSANFDLRSLYLNFEQMSLFYDPQDILALTVWIDTIRQRAQRWQPAGSGVMRETLEGLALVVAFQL